MDRLKNQATQLARQFEVFAEAIYSRMDSRAVQGGAIDDEAELCFSAARKIMNISNKISEFQNS